MLVGQAHGPPDDVMLTDDWAVHPNLKLIQCV